VAASIAITFTVLLAPTVLVRGSSSPILMVSGRDDHDLLRQDAVALSRGPGSRSPAGRVGQGILVEVLDEHLPGGHRCC
jgi:hypothetical protein